MNVNMITGEFLFQLCKTNEGSCVVSADGYNIVVAISLIIGFIWYFCFRNIIKKYQSLSASHWMINIKRPVTAVESCLIPS